MTTRYIGIDYGTVRIGLAAGDSDVKIASPLKTIPATGNTDGNIKAIIRFAADYNVDEWVVGWPLNMDDSEGPQANLTRDFAERLQRESGLTAHMHDERLSSVEADMKMAGTDLTNKKKKRRRDALAAHDILQSFLDAQP